MIRNLFNRANALRMVLVSVLLAASTFASAFTITDIRVEGLQRISAGTVFGAIPVSVGDDVDTPDLRVIIRELFKTGSFDDVQVARDGSVLVIMVKERPAIDSIEIKGSKAIKSDVLLEGLAKSGLDKGEIFKKVTLEHIRADLESQYVGQGRYGAKIDTEVQNLPRNRVKIKINVTEGKVAAIRHINIVGNKVYTNEELTDIMELKLGNLLSFYTKDNQYSKEKLTGDLEKLESWYLDRGYLNFSVDSTQVSVSADKRDVYITVNVIEGERYTVSEVEVTGELHDVSVSAVRSLIIAAPGQTYSRALMTLSEERIERALGNAGYTFASVTGQPTPEPKMDNTVKLKFFVDAGKRAYVRRINFRGNTVTQDQVLRREMRQMEGGWASTLSIENSKIRLERLGFFKEVNVETPEVPGTDDQVDVEYTVEESPSGTVSATLGYAQGTGLLLGANYQEANVFGTGNSVNLGIDHSSYQTAYSYSYFDPYYTVDGVSRGYSAFFRSTNYDNANIARYSTDAFGGSINFGYPISEVSRLGLSVGVEKTQIAEGVFPAQEISRFLAEEGNQFTLVNLIATYTMSALNRGLLPTGGRSQQLSFEMTVPGSELEFYRLQYQGQIFYPLIKGLTLRLRTELGYGDSYGKTNTFPFYKHFYSGGFGSVRGYETNSLGPRATPAPGTTYIAFDPIGGNVLIEGGAEIIFRLPLVEDQRQIKSSVFFDAGNVFNTHCPKVSTVCHDLDSGELRYSVGLSLTWITGIAPFSFSLSWPINNKQGDDSQTFQFELGGAF